MPRGIAPVFGLDLGFNSPSAAIRAYVVEESRQIYVEREAFGVVPLDDLTGLLDAVVNDPGDLETVRK